MELILILGLALSGYSVMQPASGTYQIIPDGPNVIRLDTRTGVMERCTVEPFVCKVIK